MSQFIPIEFQKSFAKTQQTAIAIRAVFSPSGNRMGSQFGGYPYWQADVEIPLDSDNTPLALLVQINFADVPTHPELPDSGILQFFIPKNDEHYGADFVDFSRAKLLSYFWPQPDESLLTDWPENLSHDDLTPVNGAHHLSFSQKQAVAGIDTIECAESLQKNPFEVLEDVSLNEKEESLFFDAICDYAAAEGHQLLGYPYFIHEEPRSNSDYRLLLQIDSDTSEDNDIMWGNQGIGQLFIRQKDLKNHRFDRVCLYWDCC